MKKQRYRVCRPKSKEKLKGFLDQLFNKTPRDHYVVKIHDRVIGTDELWELLRPYASKIEWYRKEKSLVFVLDDYDPDEVPEFLAVTPSELEASDLIDFEEIERELGFDGEF